jgi:hypothetical protein
MLTPSMPHRAAKIFARSVVVGAGPTAPLITSKPSPLSTLSEQQTPNKDNPTRQPLNDDSNIMGCQQSKTINTGSHHHDSLDKKPKKKNGSYENHGGGNVTLTTKTFRAVGDPHSILHASPTKPPRPSPLSTTLQHESFPARVLADYDIVKQIGEGPASRIFLVRPKQKTAKSTQRRNNDRRRVPNNERVVDEEGCASACSSTEPDLSEDEAFLSSAEVGTTMTRPRREADDIDDGHNKFLVLQQLNVTHLSDRKRRRMVDEIRSIQETVNHPHSTSCPKRMLLAAYTKRSLSFFVHSLTYPPAVLRIHNVYDDDNDKKKNDKAQSPSSSTTTSSSNANSASSFVAMVTDLCTGGDLRHQTPCPEEMARTILSQLLSAVSYLHHEKSFYGHDLTTDHSYVPKKVCISIHTAHASNYFLRPLCLFLHHQQSSLPIPNDGPFKSPMPACRHPRRRTTTGPIRHHLHPPKRPPCHGPMTRRRKRKTNVCSGVETSTTATTMTTRMTTTSPDNDRTIIIPNNKRWH